MQVTRTQTEDDGNTGITEIDYEEQTAGYQAAYSRLAASEGASKDPVAYVTNPLDFTVQELRGLAAREPRALELMRASVQQNNQNAHLQNFVQALATRGLTL
jgi:exportin-2 (importin alpha re-exporter)